MGLLRTAAKGAHRQTRDLDGLHVRVDDGVAVLSGIVPAEAHDAILTIANNTTSITRVRDELKEPRRGRRRARR